MNIHLDQDKCVASGQAMVCPALAIHLTEATAED